MASDHRFQQEHRFRGYVVAGDVRTESLDLVLRFSAAFGGRIDVQVVGGASAARECDTVFRRHGFCRILSDENSEVRVVARRVHMRSVRPYQFTEALGASEDRSVATLDCGDVTIFRPGPGPGVTGEFHFWLDGPVGSWIRPYVIRVPWSEEQPTGEASESKSVGDWSIEFRDHYLVGRSGSESADRSGGRVPMAVIRNEEASESLLRIDAEKTAADLADHVVALTSFAARRRVGWYGYEYWSPGGLVSHRRRG